MPSRANKIRQAADQQDPDEGLHYERQPTSLGDVHHANLLDAAIATLVVDANHGQPIWWNPVAWKWGLPAWAMSGRVFRGIAALLLWRASIHSTMPPGWLEATSPEDPTAVVIPVRKKRGWAPLLVTRAQRMAPLPVAFSKWDYESFALVLHELMLDQCPELVSYSPHIRELAIAFMQALYRSPKAPVRLVSTWTVEALTIASRIAAMIADAAYAQSIGNVFDEDAVWPRGDVAALFPWEAQEPGGLRQTLDRCLARKPDARILAHGKRAGQLPMRSYVEVRLDRIWERGRVVAGYAKILRLLQGLGLVISGDPVFDARKLGLVMARRMDRLEQLPVFGSPEVAVAWQRLAKRIKYKSWAHRLHLLTFADIRFYTRRWPPDRLLPRVRAVAKEMGGMNFDSFGQIPLKRMGLVRLLDAMGSKRPLRRIRTSAVVAAIGAFPERTYRRYPIYKNDGTRRWLDVPNEKLANLQGELMRALRPASPFAGVATAFEPGRSPAMHARMHEGAIAAVVIDIADFFGSIRPRHIRWAFHSRKGSRVAGTRGGSRLLVEGGKKVDREAILSLLFAGDGTHQWLPQGAPSSPWVANLAAHPMDRRIRKWVREYGNVKYSRYADDLVLSLHAAEGENPPEEAIVSRFLQDAEKALREAVQARGWKVQEKKTRRWRKKVDHIPLYLCGIEVPPVEGLPCKLPRQQHRRVKAALHRLRCGQASNHGLLAWAWGATGHPGWLAWTNQKLTALAVAIAGPILAESFMAGWADSVNHHDEPEEEKVDE